MIFDADVAGLIGRAVASSLPTGSAVVSIDGVEVGDLDYIDIGNEMPKTHAVPVVVKSLVFGAGAQNVYERQASASAKLR